MHFFLVFFRPKNKQTGCIGGKYIHYTTKNAAINHSVGMIRMRFAALDFHAHDMHHMNNKVHTYMFCIYRVLSPSYNAALHTHAHNFLLRCALRNSLKHLFVQGFWRHKVF